MARHDREPVLGILMDDDADGDVDDVVRAADTAGGFVAQQRGGDFLRRDDGAALPTHAIGLTGGMIAAARVVWIDGDKNAGPGRRRRGAAAASLEKTESRAHRGDLTIRGGIHRVDKGEIIGGPGDELPDRRGGRFAELARGIAVIIERQTVVPGECAGSAARRCAGRGLPLFDRDVVTDASRKILLGSGILRRPGTLREAGRGLSQQEARDRTGRDPHESMEIRFHVSPGSLSPPVLPPKPIHRPLVADPIQAGSPGPLTYCTQSPDVPGTVIAPFLALEVTFLSSAGSAVLPSGTPAALRKRLTRMRRRVCP